METFSLMMLLGVPLAVCVVIPWAFLNNLDRNNPPPPWMW